MSTSKLAFSALSTLIAAASFSLAPSAAAETRYDLSLHLGGGFASVHEVAVGVTPAAPTTPFGTGDDTVLNARGTIGAALEAQLFDQGAGLPRLLLMGGATVSLGNRVDGTFATLQGGGAQDTGLTLSSPFSVDLAVGGVFPLCRRPSCVELKAAIGLGFARRGLTVWTDETNVGGKREETTSHALEIFPAFHALVDVPLCDACSAHPTRLRLGLVARSHSAVQSSFVSNTTRAYTIGVDNQVELEPMVGLVFPL